MHIPGVRVVAKAPINHLLRVRGLQFLLGTKLRQMTLGNRTVNGLGSHLALIYFNFVSYCLALFSLQHLGNFFVHLFIVCLPI